MTERPVIVVGVDGSPESRTAVDWAAREALSRGASLRLVHVWHAPTFVGSPFFINPIPDLVFDPEQTAREDLEQARSAALAWAPALDVSVRMPGGPAALTLLEHAADAQMLVIGGTRRSTLDRAAFGSVTTHASTHAQCPVVIVRGPRDDADNATSPQGRVVVGFDRSDPSRLAASFAFDYATRHHVDVVVVEACHLPPGIRVSGDDNLLGLYRETFSEAISDVARRFPDVAMTAIAEVGHPVLVLLEHVQDADLLVVGSRGLGHFKGMLLGSVSAALVHQSPVSLAVVR